MLLVVPSGPTTSISAGTSSKRARFWHNQLSVLGKVVPVTMHTSNGGSGVSISQCLDHIIGAVRIKVLEVKFSARLFKLASLNAHLNCVLIRMTLIIILLLMMVIVILFMYTVDSSF